MAKQWRYHLHVDASWDKRELSQQLRKLGLEGWELVSVHVHRNGEREFWFKQETVQQV